MSATGERVSEDSPQTIDAIPYVSIAKWGNCKVCAVHQDLRFGVCFHCSDKVCGEKVSDVTHRLWETKNPSNVWFCSEKGDA